MRTLWDAGIRLGLLVVEWLRAWSLLARCLCVVQLVASALIVRLDTVSSGSITKEEECSRHPGDLRGRRSDDGVR